VGKCQIKKRFNLLRLGHLCSSEVIEHCDRDTSDKGLVDSNTEGQFRSVTRGRGLAFVTLLVSLLASLE
jgi:hypothetical protein